MGYFDLASNVDEYLRMAEGYDGAELIAELAEHVSFKGRVLELGMGSGKDLRLLKNAGFEPVGSDVSRRVLSRYRRSGGEFPTLEADVADLRLSEQFSAIYSNKVLHVLSPQALTASLSRMVELLPPRGAMMHSFWFGVGTHEENGAVTYFYRPEEVIRLTPQSLKVLHTEMYEETQEADSFWVLFERV